MNTSRSCRLFAFLALALALAPPRFADSDNPPRPSSFHGSVRVGNRPAPSTLPISAWIGQRKIAEASLLRDGAATRYLLHLPADLPETAAVEGGLPGQQVVFRVGASEGIQQGEWQDGQHRLLDLELTAGPDLAVGLSDGVLNVARADVLNYTITLENRGSREATGIEAIFEPPPYCQVSTIGEGGAAAGGHVAWPPATLGPGASLTRHVQVQVRRSAPLIAGSLRATARFLSPPDNGLDPVSANDEASDTDLLAAPNALPNLAISYDGLEVTPLRPSPGQAVDIRATVRNIGAATAFDPLVEVLAGDPEAGGVSLARVRLGDLAPGANRQIQLAWPAVAGVTAIVATADPDEELLETERRDNTVERQVVAPPATGPDLRLGLGAGALEQSPLSLVASGRVQLELRNGGAGAVTRPFSVEIFVDRGGDGHRDEIDPLLFRQRFDAGLGAGAVASLEAPIEAGLPFLHPLVFAAIDSDEEVDETDEANNLLAIFGDCPLPAPAPSLELTEEWWATDLEAQVAPLVVQLSDDNGDLAIDSRDTPDVVLLSEDAQGRMIVALSGLDGQRLFTYRGGPGSPLPFPGGQLAAADLDNDAVAEIVAPLQNGRLLCLDHQGSLVWTSPPVEGVGERWLGSIAVGDLDGDGRPELAVGRVVISAEGAILAQGSGNTNRGLNYNFYGPFGAVLVPGATDYPQSVIADLDLDGRAELVAGDAVYRLSGGQLQLVWNRDQPDRLMVDGFAAVGNLGGDPQPEIVYVSSGQVAVYKYDGSNFAGRTEITPIATATMPTFWGGPPTIADLDGDGLAEVLIASATEIVAMRGNLSVLWRRPIGPDFGAIHGLTAFDFDGDGDREVIYLDEHDFYLVDGRSGAVLQQLPNTSKTGTEYPVVADVDGDGRAEILLPANTSFDGDASKRGLHVLGNPGWRGARTIWNQYSCQPEAILADGTVPRPKTPPTRAENSFRVQLDAEPPAAFLPNPTLSLPWVGAPSTAGVPITLRLGNGGRGFLSPGLSLRIYAGDPAAGQPVVDTRTRHGLKPGSFVDETYYYTGPIVAGTRVTAVLDEPGALAECRDDDNRIGFPVEATFQAELEFAPPRTLVLPALPIAGQKLSLGASIRNTGEAQSAPAVLAFYLDAAGSGPRVAETPLPPIASGATFAATATWDSLGIASGPHTVWARIDDLAQVPERDESNNELSGSLTLATPAKPDLAVDLLEISPTSPIAEGVPALISATLRNRGTATLDPSAAKFLVNNVEIAQSAIPPLASGEPFTWQVSFDTLDRAGQLQAAVIADPANTLAEISETNNRLNANFTVASGAIGLQASTDRLSYAAGQTVLVRLAASNATPEAERFDLLVTVRDAFGAPVAILAQQSWILPAGASTLSFPWPLGAAPAGAYSVMAELRQGAVLRRRAVASFTVAADLRAAVSVTAHQDHYAPEETVDATAIVVNSSANSRLENLAVRSRIKSPLGTVALDDQRQIAALERGDSTSFELHWPAGTAAPGTWRIQVEIRSSVGLLIGYGESTFAIEDSSQTGAGLHGDLALAPSSEVARGATLVADALLSFGGNADLLDLPLRAELVADLAGTVIATDRLELDLPRGGGARARFHFPTAAVPEGGYQVILWAEPPAGERRLDSRPIEIQRGITISDASGVEGDSGTSLLELEVELSSPALETITVRADTLDASARAPEDYETTGALLVFAPGETRKTLVLPVFGDLLPEAPEVLAVRLSEASGARIADELGLATILDEEGCGSPNLVRGGDAEAPFADGFTFAGTLRQRAGAPQPVAGDWEFELDGTLTQTLDLSPFAAMIDAGGQRFQLLLFAQGGSANADFLDAGGGGLSASTLSAPDPQWTPLALGLEAPAGARLLQLRLQGAGAFFDRLELRSIGTPTLAIAGAAQAEGNAGSAPVSLPVGLSCPTTEVVIGLVSEDLEARAGSDYQALATTLVLPAGATSGTAEVEVFGDGTDEEDENFLIRAATTTPGVVLLSPQVRVAILDDDGPALLSVSDAEIQEGDSGVTQAVFAVELSSASGRRVEVSYATVAASAGSADFVAGQGRLVFEPGTTRIEVAVAVRGDLLDELDESFLLRLSSPLQASLADGEGEGRIRDDDQAELSIDNVAVFEGDTAPAILSFTVRLSRESDRTVEVAYATADGGATGGSDFVAISGSLTFPPGTTTGTIEVRSIPDLEREGDETFLVLLSQPVEATLALPEGQGMLADDDGILLSVADLAVAEPATGNVTAQVEVSLNKAVAQPVVIELTTRDGSALAGLDYDAVATTVTLPAGATKVKANIPVRSDAEAELVETFTVQLRNPPPDAALLDPEAQVSIVDEDQWHLNGQSNALVIPGCVRLTQDLGDQLGTAWRKAKIDLGFNFDKTFKVFLGGKDSGADGLVFALQNQIATAQGRLGDGIGYGGITPSVGIEIDTWKNNSEQDADHLAVDLNGSVLHNGMASVQASATSADIEDGREHDLRVIWNAETRQTEVRFDDTHRVLFEKDLVATYFANTAQVFYGFTSATGSSGNLHYFCETELCAAGAEPKISVGNAFLSEGTVASSEASFTLTLSCPTDHPVTVDWATEDGTAVSGADYLAAGGTLTFAPGQTSANVHVTVLGDSRDEPDETFGVRLTGASGAPLRYVSGLATVRDDDFSWTLNGNAAEILGGACIQLTPEQNNSQGSAWNTRKADLTQHFDTEFDVYLGRSDVNGADGIAFVFQNQGANALSIGGGTLGYTTLTPAAALEVDTYYSGAADLVEDHLELSFRKTSQLLSTPVAASAVSTNIEDDRRHRLRILWNAAARQLSASFDGEERLFYDRDLLANEFTSSPQVFWGFTGATGGLNNLQYFCPVTYCSGLEASPQVSAGIVRLPEGVSGAPGLAKLPVTLSCPTDHPVTLSYSTADGTARAGEDYLAAAGTLTFEPGEVSKTVNIPLIADNREEPAEKLYLELGAIDGAQALHPRGEVSISGDQVLELPSPALVEGDPVVGGPRRRNLLEFRFSSPLASPLRLTYSTSSGTAAANVDFQAASSFVDAPIGATRALIPIEILPDLSQESDETFFVDVAAPGVRAGRYTVVLLDDDHQPTRNLLRNAGGDQADPAGNPSDWVAAGGSWKVRTGNPPPFAGAAYLEPGAVAVGELYQDVDLASFATFADSGVLVLEAYGMVRSAEEELVDAARIVVEYRDGGGQVLASMDSGPIASKSAWQMLAERRAAPPGTRTLRIRLLASRNPASIAANEAFFDDLMVRALGVPAFSASDLAVDEGETGSREVLVPVSLFAPAPVTTQVGYFTADGTASAGSDYQPAQGTLVFAPGEVSKTVALRILGDGLREPDETLLLHLADPQNAVIDRSPAQIKIVQDELTLTMADAEVVEGDGGSPSASPRVRLTATLSAPSTLPVYWSWRTAPAPGAASATPDADFVSASGTLEIPPGTTQAHLEVQIQSDEVGEADELFRVILESPINANANQGFAQVEIVDDDLAISVEDLQIREGAAGERPKAEFIVSLARSGPSPVKVSYATSGLTATAGVDFLATSGQLTFAPGETRQSVFVTILGDAEIESGESFSLQLSEPVTGRIGRGEGFAFIVDDDECSSPQLVRNWGFENYVALQDWSGTRGTTVGRSDFQFGNAAARSNFTVTPGSTYEIAQEVSLADYAALIARGGQRLSFQVFVKSDAEAVPDTARVRLELLDVSRNLLPGAFDSGETASFTWSLVGDKIRLPEQARYARIRLIGKNYSGTTIDSRFDSVDLRLLGLPILTLSGGPRIESDSGLNDLPFFVRLSCGQPEPISVRFATISGGTASAGGDYQPTTTTVTFAPGETLKVVGVPVVGDTTGEADETVKAELTDSPVAFIATAGATGKIFNDDLAGPNQALLIGTVRDFEDFGTDFENTVIEAPDPGIVETQLGADGTPVYRISTVNPTITSPESFAAWFHDVPGLNLAAQVPIVLTRNGSLFTYTNNAFFPVDGMLFGNSRFTNNYHFTYEIHSRIGYAGGETFSFTGDDDIWVFINKKLAIDLGGIHGPLTGLVRLDDLRASHGLQPGNSYDFDFFFAERHTTASFFQITTNFALDAVNPGQLAFTAPQYTVSEGAPFATIGVSRSSGADGPVSVEFTTMAGGTATADADYRSTTTRVAFASGELGIKTVTVPILQDGVFEDTETVQLALRNTTGGAEVGMAAASLAILDDRSRLSVEGESVAEGNAGTSPLRFTVRLDHASVGVVEVGYTTLPGSADSADFSSTSGTLVFAPGETVKTITVDVVGDLRIEEDESFQLRLDPALGAEIAQGLATGTIVNDDVRVCDGPNLLRNGGAEAALFTSLTPGWTATGGPFRVLRTNPSPFEGGASFVSGEAGGELEQTVDLLPYAERIDAGQLAFRVRGRLWASPGQGLARLELEFIDADGASLASWQSDWLAAGQWLAVEQAQTAPDGARFARLRLVANGNGAFDAIEMRSLAVPVLTIDDVALAEKTGRPAPFTLSLSCPLEQALSVGATTADGSALAGADYLATSGSRTFAVGETRAPFWVPIVSDTIAEPTETFEAAFSGSPAGVVLLDPRGEATVYDSDDAPPDAMICEEARFASPPAGFTASALGDAQVLAADSVGEQLRLSGTGSLLYHGPDNAAFYRREASGDFRVEVDIESLPQQNASRYRKVGLMLRDDGDPQAARVMIEYIPDFQTGPALQFDARAGRGQTPTELASTQVGIQLPVRLAMIKRGKRVTVLFSTDRGATWVQPLGAKGGSIEITAADPLEVGANVTSYDLLQPLTGAFDDFRVCRGATLPPPAPEPPCDSRPIDAVLLVDVSGSMKRPHGPLAGNSRLDSVRDTLAAVLQGLAARGDGSRSALIVTSGSSFVVNNLTNGARLVKGFDAGTPAVLAALQQLDDAPIGEQASSPAAIALREVLEVLVAQRDPTHRAVLIWATDNLGNIDAAGRGPRFYTDAELQAVSLLEGATFVSGPEKVILQGNFNPLIFTYDGQAVADAMIAADRLLQTEPLRAYALVPRGDGSPERPLLREDLVAWLAARSGGEVFGAADRQGLLDLAQPLLEAISCTPRP